MEKLQSEPERSRGVLAVSLCLKGHKDANALSWDLAITSSHTFNKSPSNV